MGEFGSSGGDEAQQVVPVIASQQALEHASGLTAILEQLQISSLSTTGEGLLEVKHAVSQQRTLHSAIGG